MKTAYHWKLKDLKEAALPYQHRYQFRDGNMNAYRAALYHGLLDVVCAHMTYRRTPPKWTVEMLTAEAAKYQTRWEFGKGSPNAYGAAHRRKLIDQVCAHMEPKI